MSGRLVESNFHNDSQTTSGSSSPPNAELAVCKVFSLEELTAQLVLSRPVLLRIGDEGVDSADTPEEYLSIPEEDAAGALLDTRNLIDTLDLKPVDAIENIIILDIGKLLGGSENALLFQLNTSQGVFIYRASSERQKKEICNLIRVMAEMKEPTVDLGLRTSGPARIQGALYRSPKGIENLVNQYESICEQYEAKLMTLRAALADKANSLASITTKFQQLEETNASILESLHTAQKQNEALAARLSEVDRVSLEAGDRIASMQRKMDERREIMLVKSRLLDTLDVRLSMHSGPQKWNWRDVIRTALAVVLIGVVAHYIWMLFLLRW
ncbi:hypothetical protein HK104_009017 [Borealophlyctis nickersoniae]|nr:hypothetical protein HK104_009017 [Borealophlyctis nickersoniae]